MATTDFGALSSAQKIVWANRISRAGLLETFWMSGGLVSSGTDDLNRPVQRITELTKTTRGSKCIMQLVAELSGFGVAGDGELTGNEEALVNETVEINIDQLRNGVKSAGRMAEQDTVVRFRSQAMEKLKYWLAKTVDELTFLTVSGRAYSLNTNGTTRSDPNATQLRFAGDVVAATTNRILFPGSATSEGTLSTADTMSWDFLIGSKAFAKRKVVRPIREGGREYYAVVMSNEQLRDLKRDQDFKDAAGRGLQRGPRNTLFSGAEFMVDGLAIFEHQQVFNTLGLSSGSKWGNAGTVDGAQALLLGAQSAALATIDNPSFEEADQTDYMNRPGLAFGRIFGLLKPQYKSPRDSNSLEDFGCVSLKTAAAST